MPVIRENTGFNGRAAGNGEMPGQPGTSRPETVRELVGDRTLDLLLARSKDEDGQLRLTGEGSMLGELVRAVLERALEAEMAAHLGYEPHERAGHNSGNSRNGTIAKTVQTGVGPVPLAVPRDRAGSFEPVLVPKRAGRITGGLDDMVIPDSKYPVVREASVTSPTTWSRSTAPCCRPRPSRGSPRR